MHLLSVTTIFLLLGVGNCGNYSEFGKLIGRIKKEIEPSTVYLVGVDAEYLSEISNNDFNMPLVIFTYFQSVFSALKSIEENIILVVQVDENPSLYHVIEQFVQRLHVRMFVTIITDNRDVFKDYCLYFTDGKFSRIFGIVNGIGFAYLQYAERPVQLLTNDGPLPNALKDLNGFNFRTTVQNDFPRTFWYQNRKGLVEVGGYVARLFVTFVHKHNATFSDILINNSSDLSIPGVIAATINGDIDISMNACIKPGKHAISYPILLQPWTILVPLNGYVNPNEYFLKPFALTVWIYICVALVYTIVAHIINDFYTNEPVNLWTYFSQTLLLLIGKPTGTDLIRGRRIHIQVILLSHILVNIYCNHLTSFLTVYIKTKEWNTLPDLIANNVSIMIPEHEWDYISHNDFEYKDIVNIINPVNNTVHMRELNSMHNQNFAYTVSLDIVEFLLKWQEKMSRPLFHRIHDGLYDFHLGFIMDRHSPFAEILKNCILQAREAGLIQKWTNDVVWEGAMAGLLPVPVPPEELLVPLNLNHLRFAWNCLIIGLMMAMITFLGEQHRRVFG